jgi:methylated-DNA-[protein]-cysteine S-methyltransferase
MSTTTERWIHTPLGWLLIRGHAAGLTEVSFREERGKDSVNPDAPVLVAAEELMSYFEGKNMAFTVPLAPEGTDFQKQVWERLASIPAGETRTYIGLATELQNPGAVRAVGTANGANPIAVILPCHRVIGADGKLTGYAGGLWRKEWLLAHEARLAPKGQLPLF